jgi:predicted PurR-regulated permease PerM
MSKEPEPSQSLSARLSLPLSDSELPAVQKAGTGAGPSTPRGRRIALGILLAMAFMVVAWTASPLWVGILLGTVMAFTLQSLYRWLSAKFGNRPHLAAATTTFVAGLFCLVFGALAAGIFTRELVATAKTVQTELADGTLLESLSARGAVLFEKIHVNREEITNQVRSQVGDAANYVVAAVPALARSAAGAVLQLVIALMTMYYVLIEWPHLAVRLENVLPLDPRHTRALLLEFRDVGRGTLRGTLITALIQGVLGGIGFAIARVPHPLTWAMATAIGSFIPVVGTVLVWGPIAIVLLATGHVGGGILTLAWGFIVVVGFCDYVIRPRVIGAGGHTHPFLMLISLLGGIEIFQIPGLLLGPILMSLFLAVLRLYERESKRANDEMRAKLPAI